MESIIDFFKSNYEWIFGGIGVATIAGLIKIFWKKPTNVDIRQKQKSGNNSTNIQVGQINEEKNER
ncbi:hypothetical protein KKG19_04580 [Patescibacteria group bacterium]|nr:hypothetical protein [Patescibacteria group bacterium]